MEIGPNFNIQQSIKAKLELMKNQVKNQINSISFSLKKKRNIESRTDLAPGLAVYEVLTNIKFLLKICNLIKFDNLQIQNSKDRNETEHIVSNELSINQHQEEDSCQLKVGINRCPNCQKCAGKGNKKEGSAKKFHRTLAGCPKDKEKQNKQVIFIFCYYDLSVRNYCLFFKRKILN